MSTIGTTYKQPRVFAHDAWPVVIGAINYTWNQNIPPKLNEHQNLDKAGIKITNPGTGYRITEDVVLTIAGSATAAATFIVDDIDSSPVTAVGNDLITSTTTNQTDFVDGTYTGTVGVTAGYSTSGGGTGLNITITVSGNTATAVVVNTVGTGFTSGVDTITVTGSGGILGGATGNLVLTVGTGAIASYYFDKTNAVDLGVGYSVGDTETQASSSDDGIGMTCTITNIDIPNTEEAGCCLYFSGAAAADVTVIMEAAKYSFAAVGGYGYAQTDRRTFELVNPGSFMPIMVKQVTSALASAGDILALY